MLDTPTPDSKRVNMSSPLKSCDNIIKKLSIKNFKDPPKLPDNYVTETLGQLQRGVVAIQTSTSVADSLECLYQCVENLCMQKMTATLYNCLSEMLESHVMKTIDEQITSQTGSSQFLVLVWQCWTHHCHQTLMIRSVFLHMDRTYAVRNAGVLPIWDLSMSFFRRHFLSRTSAHQHVIDCVLDLVESERQDELGPNDISLLKNIINMFIQLGIYNDYFERNLLTSMKRLYSCESLSQMETSTISEYLRYVNSRLEKERNLSCFYFKASTQPPLISIVVEELLTNHAEEILKRGTERLLTDNNTEDLALMYALFSYVPDGKRMLAEAVRKYINTGSKYVTDPSRDPSMVQNLLDFKDKMDDVVSTCFQNNPAYIVVLKEAFESFINLRANKPAEMLAKYLDAKLRLANKKHTPEEIETLFDKVVVLFRFAHGKDVFEAYYKKDLAKRLLLGRSASVDAEKCFLAKLRAECGAGFTGKLEAMFTDMELSADLNTMFKKNALGELPDVELHVNVLTAASWPTYTVSPEVLPLTLAQQQLHFTQFYQAKHSGRKLQWQTNLGRCILLAFFPKGNRELVVSLHQTLVLLQFNQSPALTHNELLLSTCIPAAELGRVLQSLSCGKHRVLKKNPRGKDVSCEDVFTYNDDFGSPLYRMKINQVLGAREVEAEESATNARVHEDRLHQLDAAVVRLMKTRKAMTHRELVGEVFAHLGFPVKLGDVKLRIESLILRDYLKRGEEPGETSTYFYVA